MMMMISREKALIDARGRRLKKGATLTSKEHNWQLAISYLQFLEISSGKYA